MKFDKSSKLNRLNIFMNGIAVGLLVRENSGALAFKYHRSWLDKDQSVPISRNFQLREDAYIGNEVRNYFDNLLPDDQRIRERIAARAKAGGTQAFDILAAIGRDCIGALQFYPKGSEPGSIKPVCGHPLQDMEIAELLRNLRINPLGINMDHDFRISLAGAQNKTALLRYNNQWLLPEAATPTTHIFKPAIGLVPGGPDLSLSIENEWLCLKLMRAFGLQVASAEIAEFDGTKVLIVERFDRLWSKDTIYRLPQEDFCQALGLSSDMKYESDGGPSIVGIMDVLNESDHRDRDRQQFLKAQIIFWLISAIDGHAKNFSLFIRTGGTALTPIYDVMSAEPHVSARNFQPQKIKLAMSVGKNRHYKIREILPRHWIQTADSCKFDGIITLLQEIAASTDKAIETVTAELPRGFPQEVSEKILITLEKRVKTIPTYLSL